MVKKIKYSPILSMVSHWQKLISARSPIDITPLVTCISGQLPTHDGGVSDLHWQWVLSARALVARRTRVSAFHVLPRGFLYEPGIAKVNHGNRAEMLAGEQCGRGEWRSREAGAGAILVRFWITTATGL